MKINDLVEVKWLDSDGCPQGWVHHTDIHPVAVSEITSVGYVQCLDDVAVRVTPHIAYNSGRLQCVQGYMTIPLLSVTSVRILK